jgi:hypothetical protein
MVGSSHGDVTMANRPETAEGSKSAEAPTEAAAPSSAPSPEELAEKVLQEELLDLFEEEMRGRPDCEGA